MGAEDRGSALMLMPAAVLVVIVLSAIAVDGALAFMGRRELSAAAAAAANDAVVAALSERGFYEACGDLSLDPAAAQRVAERTFALRASEAYRLEAVEATVGTAPGGGPQVRVEATGAVERVFTPALLGGGAQRVRAGGEAVAERAVDVAGDCRR